MNSQAPGRNPPAGPGLREKAKSELVSYLQVSAYLFVCFGALLFYADALLREEGVTTVSLGFAAGKALILGKFLLLGESAGVGRRFKAQRLWIAILRQALLMWLLLILLSVIEECLVGLVHGHSLAQTLADYQRHSVLALIAKSIVLLMVLLPMIATTELSRALGPGVLRGLLLSAERDTEQHGRHGER